MKPFLLAVRACAPRSRCIYFLAAMTFVWAPPTWASTITSSPPAFGPSNNGIISGYVYYDANGDGKPETTDWALSGAEVSLTNILTSTSVDVYTAMDGSYEFTGLAAGTYTIEMVTPSSSPEVANLGVLCDSSGVCIAYNGLDAKGNVVPAAGAASLNMVSDITLGPGYTAKWYDFGQLVFPVDLFSKRLLIGGGNLEQLPPTVIPPPPVWGPPVPEPSVLAMTFGAGLLATFARFAPRRRRT